MKRLLLASTLLWTLAVSAQEPAQPVANSGNQDPFVPATFDDFRLRAVGPAIASGRVGSIAVHPENKQTWYIGVSSGGVWKTTNAGITFTPVFQNEGSYAIGTVVIDPKNPSTLIIGYGHALVSQFLAASSSTARASASRPACRFPRCASNTRNGATEILQPALCSRVRASAAAAASERRLRGVRLHAHRCATVRRHADERQQEYCHLHTGRRSQQPLSLQPGC